MMRPPDLSFLILTLTFLLLLRQHQGEECPDDTIQKDAIVGMPLLLQPPSFTTQIPSELKWKKKLSSTDNKVLWTWKNETGEASASSFLTNLNNTWIVENHTLYIKATEKQTSGLYILESTFAEGRVYTIWFIVSVFDHVKRPDIQEDWKPLGTGRCQMTLSCLVSMEGDVNYTWYRDGELLQVSRNATFMELWSDANGKNTYTCNVSNPASWASHTITINQGCQSAHQGSKFLPFLVVIVILTMLFLGTVTCFCVCRRKRKQSETSPTEFLTVYEDIKELKMRSQQQQQQQQQEQQEQQEQEEEQQKPPEGSTIYSMIHAQAPASVSQDASNASNTLYALVQTSRKSASKKKTRSSPVSYSIYDEVGSKTPKAQNPARLSRKELESFDIYP